MKNFISIDFETANSRRVSACSMGYAIVEEGKIVETGNYLIRPIGDHHPFNTRIHKITQEETKDKPSFAELFEEIKHLFDHSIVGYSLFDKQVLNALKDHYNLPLACNYTDACDLAKRKIPDLKNHKLKTLNNHFNLPNFQHHNSEEDAIACAKVFLALDEVQDTLKTKAPKTDKFEFIGLAKGILADDEVNYKEAYSLLYWLQDHSDFCNNQSELYWKLEEVLEDDYLDCIESIEIKMYLEQSLKQLL